MGFTAFIRLRTAWMIERPAQTVRSMVPLFQHSPQVLETFKYLWWDAVPNRIGAMALLRISRGPPLVNDTVLVFVTFSLFVAFAALAVPDGEPDPVLETACMRWRCRTHM
jgi:hypothetical protein